jgi:hypothetical protein
VWQPSIPVSPYAEQAHGPPPALENRKGRADQIFDRDRILKDAATKLTALHEAETKQPRTGPTLAGVLIATSGMASCYAVETGRLPAGDRLDPASARSRPRRGTV